MNTAVRVMRRLVIDSGLAAARRPGMTASLYFPFFTIVPWVYWSARGV